MKYHEVHHFIDPTDRSHPIHEIYDVIHYGTMGFSYDVIHYGTMGFSYDVIHYGTMGFSYDVIHYGTMGFKFHESLKEIQR